MIHHELNLPASLFLYGTAPIVDGTVSDCVRHWQDNMSQLGQALCRVRVNAPKGAYWMAPEDIRDLAHNALPASSKTDY
ncbi:MAG: hypothetical protein H0U98_12505 [Alphaproteobacteria bacterium]|nr:hypothetical protein [Alphaproteobacteria bacterium]